MKIPYYLHKKTQKRLTDNLGMHKLKALDYSDRDFYSDEVKLIAMIAVSY